MSSDLRRLRLRVGFVLFFKISRDGPGLGDFTCASRDGPGLGDLIGASRDGPGLGGVTGVSRDGLGLGDFLGGSGMVGIAGGVLAGLWVVDWLRLRVGAGKRGLCSLFLLIPLFIIWNCR